MKKKEDLTIAHMLTLAHYTGCVDIWEDGEPPNPLMIQYERNERTKPEWLRHVTHAHSVAGAGAAGDALEAQHSLPSPRASHGAKRTNPAILRTARLFYASSATRIARSRSSTIRLGYAKYGLPVTVADMPRPSVC